MGDFSRVSTDVLSCCLRPPPQDVYNNVSVAILQKWENVWLNKPRPLRVTLTKSAAPDEGPAINCIHVIHTSIHTSYDIGVHTCTLKEHIEMRGTEASVSNACSSCTRTCGRFFYRTAAQKKMKKKESSAGRVRVHAWRDTAIGDRRTGRA